MSIYNKHIIDILIHVRMYNLIYKKNQLLEVKFILINSVNSPVFSVLRTHWFPGYFVYRFHYQV